MCQKGEFIIPSKKNFMDNEKILSKLRICKNPDFMILTILPSVQVKLRN